MANFLGHICLYHLSDHCQYHRRKIGEHCRVHFAGRHYHLPPELYRGRCADRSLRLPAGPTGHLAGFSGQPDRGGSHLDWRVAAPAPFWDGQGAYDTILGYTPRLLIASFIAYLVGEFSNAFVLAKLKIATQGRWLWVRTIGSTLVGQGLDSFVFITIAFAGTIPTAGLMSVIVTQWLAKSLYEAAATPLTYWVVNFLKRKEGLDVYDYDTRFNPLLVTE